jgi:circadian clock protein KaiB
MSEQQADEQPQMVLRLYVAGATRRSTYAITTLLEICETHFSGRYQLEILDIYQHAERARDDAILATPTLMLVSPGPGRYFVGDFQQTGRLFVALGIGGAL